MLGRKRPPMVVWIIPILIGFAGFYRVTQSPSFEVYRAVDVVQLLGRRLVQENQTQGLGVLSAVQKPFASTLTRL